MKINPYIKMLPPADFFGVKNQNYFLDFGVGNLISLGIAMQKKMNCVDFGQLRIDSIPNFVSVLNPNDLLEFRRNRLAKLTLTGDIFRHSSDPKSFNTHAIGLVINNNPNEYFYKSRPQILVLDSLGNKSTEMQHVHNKLTDDFIKKIFTDAEVIFNTEPQQTDNSLTCLNWTIANLEVAKENLGRTDIIEKLPKSSDIGSILEKQKIIVQEYMDKR